MDEEPDIVLFSRSDREWSHAMKSDKKRIEKEHWKDESGDDGLLLLPNPQQDEPKTFKNFNIPSWLNRRLLNLGIEKPTDVQKGTIPYIMKGMNVIGEARTGQGKTLCFAIPILSDLSIDPGAFRALVLTPTRELALQIGDQFQLISEHAKMRVQILIGGMDILEQIKLLELRPHIVIATPGRLQEILKQSKNLSLMNSFKRIKCLVMDEADRLLQPEFGESLSVILSSIPSDRQTLLFSATMTVNMKKLVEICPGNRKPFIYNESRVGGGESTLMRDFEPILKNGIQVWQTPDTLNMEYIFVPHTIKECYLVYLLYRFKSQKGIIVFVKSCETCEIIASMIHHTNLGLKVTRLHRRMKQVDRNASLVQFKSGNCHILVATDLASRGLDVPEVSLVIQMNVPSDPRDYIHRVGRTARKKKSGTSILMIDQHQVSAFLKMEKHLMSPIKELEIDEDKVIVHLNETLTARETGKLQLIDNGFFDRLEKLKNPMVCR